MPGPEEKPDASLKSPAWDEQQTASTLTPASPGAAAPPDLNDPLLKPLAERFELLKELGRGGMGVVYKARDREAGETVALKVLLPQIAAQVEIIERFKAELRLARKITHKNVCRTYDLHRFGPAAAIAMEYIEGENLRSLLNRVEGLSVRHAMKILRQVIAGLGEAHAQGVVHRDLKPENILLARDGTVKVMDFGIARSVQAPVTVTSSLVGTPAYMSPEQAESKTADARSDIYSLGLMMYEMFTGQHPFRAESPVAMAMKQVQEAAPPPRQVEPDLPERVDRAIQKCLEKDPAKRFQSVAELETALSGEPAAEVTPEGDPIPPPHLSVWRRADAVLLLLGIAGLIYFLVIRDSVLPASKLRLEVDAITAKRTAEEMASRLGMRPFETSRADAQLQFRTANYLISIQEMFWFPVKKSPFDKPWLAEPIAWRVAYGYSQSQLRNKLAFAIVDAKGKVEEITVPSWIPGNYKPASLEDRLQLARRAAENACGPLPEKNWLTQTAGGEQNASYSATWGHGLFSSVGEPVTEIDLMAERATRARCVFPSDFEFPNLAVKYWFTGTIIGVSLVVFFLLGRCYRVPWLWKRAPLAVLLGLASVWMVTLTGPNSGGSATLSAFPAFPLLVMACIAASAVALVVLVTVEYYLRRRVPDKIASYALAWSGQLSHSSLGLAVVRGALLGLGLVALETLLAHLTLNFSLKDVKPSLFLSVIVDPAPVALAIESTSPALYAVAAAFLNGMVISFVFLGLTRVIFSKSFTQPMAWYGRPLIYLGAAIFWMLIGVPLHLVQFTILPAGWALAWMLEAWLLVWLLDRYDVLTIMAAVATAVLWIINYPLLVIFQTVGNGAHWAVFCGWAAVVALAAASAARPSLANLRHRIQAAAG